MAMQWKCPDPASMPGSADPQRLIPRQRSVGQRVKASFVASDRTYGARAVSGWICCQKASHAVMHRKRRSQGKHAA